MGCNAGVASTDGCATRSRGDSTRDAIVAATIGVVGQRGYHETPLAEIAAVAGVSLTTLYDHYRTREECFLAAYRQASEELTEIALDAYAAETEWPDALHAGLRALLEAAAADPARARVCFVEVQAAGRRPPSVANTRPDDRTATDDAQ